MKVAPMHRKRLEMMADYLEGKGKFEGRGVNESKFHLDCFMDATDTFINDRIGDLHSKGYDHLQQALKTRDTSQPAFTDPIPGTEEIEVNFCQTIGCAMGWAATMPEFRAMGLHLRKSPRHGRNSAAIFYMHYEGTDAMGPFFEIHNGTSYYLFLSSHYPRKQTGDPKAVANRIRKLLEMGDTTEFRNWCRNS